jgi:hypothetical protein
MAPLCKLPGMAHVQEYIGARVRAPNVGAEPRASDGPHDPIVDCDGGAQLHVPQLDVDAFREKSGDFVVDGQRGPT